MSEEDNAGDIQCRVTLEVVNATNGAVEKKTAFNKAKVSIGRNDFNDLLLRLDTGDKHKICSVYPLKNVKVFHRFASEGKCTLKIDRHTVMMSNCAPYTLKTFLNTLLAKMKCDSLRPAPSTPVSARHRLLSKNKDRFTEISPITNKNVKTLTQNRCLGLRKRDANIANLAANKPHAKVTKRSFDQRLTMANGGKENSGSPAKKLPRLSPTASPSPIRRLLSAGISSLSVEQRHILRTVLSGCNIFFTGSAGTGKSFLLRNIIGSLSPQHTYATASTGVAACHIGGSTLHAFAGIGTGSATIEKCVELAMRPTVKKHWLQCKHLIIDEISMVDGAFLDKMELVARHIRRNNNPFGGIQLIFCGDFFQLPPVTKGDISNRKYAFQSKSWRRCIDKNMQLCEVRRQTDNKFIEILQKIRRGVCTKDMVKVLNSTVHNSLGNSGIVPTRLCTHNEDVNQLNNIYLQRLDASAKHEYLAKDSHPEHGRRMKTLSQVSDKIELRIGAQVMITKNIDIKAGLVNGSRGVVVDFDKGSTGYPKVKMMDGSVITFRPEKVTFKLSTSGGQGSIEGTMSRLQLPLKLAWAISIHKSQGMSLDNVEMSLSKVFESGQAYVALSRATSLKGLRITDFDSSCIRADKYVQRFYENMCKQSMQNIKQSISFN